MPERKKIIEIINLEKIYYATIPPTYALKGINLVVREGDFLAIMGASGSGKSTLMNTVGLLDKPTKGIYRLAGWDVTKLDENRIAEIRNRIIGFVFQAFHLLPDLTAIENVELPMIYANIGPGERKEKATKALGAVGLGERLGHKPSQLSGGQIQRVAIARALVLNPELILGDEPTGNLDTKSSYEVMDIFTKLNREGKTIVLITHEPDIARYAKKVVHIRDGMLYEGTPS